VQLGKALVSVSVQAVVAAKEAWGERQLAELDAEDKLAIACERAPTSDPVIAKLRAAFQAKALLPVFRGLPYEWFSQQLSTFLF
jgi:hypothetical protein